MRGADGPLPATVPELMAAQTAACEDRDLLVSGSGRLSYGEADERSARLSEGLLSLGVTKGTRVGVLLPNGVDFVVAWFAVTRIGAVFVSFNTFVKPPELLWQLHSADVHTLILRDRFLSNDYADSLSQALPGLSTTDGTGVQLATLPTLRNVIVDSATSSRPSWAVDFQDLCLSEQGLAELRTATEAAVAPADDAVVIYTSGSTAEPKGVIHTQGTVVRHPAATNARRGLKRDDRVYLALPLFWVAGMSHGLVGTYAGGACLVVDEVFEPGTALDAIEQHRVTLVSGWPFHGEALRNHPSYSSRGLEALRTDVRNLLTPPGATVRLADWPGWVGMTETFGAHLLAPMDERLPVHLAGSLGTSLPGFEHRIVDPSGEDLPPGETGELLVRGYAVMRGYVGREREDTFERDGFFRTGDLGHFSEEGHFFLSGRTSDVIKSSGTNVSPGEVAAALERIDGIVAAHVVGVPDDARGEAVVAGVVAEKGRDVDLADVLAQVRRELSGFKVPRHLVRLTQDEVPMTATGKVSRGQLRALLADRLNAEKGSDELRDSPL